MNCHVCGAEVKPIITDLPFKLRARTIVIIKDLPVLQCTNCREFLIEAPIMKRVDAILDNVSDTAELEVVRFAA
jgi:YgiT-type zinc finger domain-containing protein